MTRKGQQDSPASILARLRKSPSIGGLAWQQVLERYVHERLLYRLTVSRHADAFVLKGAMLLATLLPGTTRPTRDLDLLGTGEPRPARLRDIFREIAALDGGGDAVVFDRAKVEARPIREDAVYPGVRVTLHARLGQARVRAQVDIGFGDAVDPPPRPLQYPSLLDLPAPRIRGYPPEAVVAEKLQAMVALGLKSSRLRDLHDLRALASALAFDGPTLVRAVRTTFARRQTTIPAEAPEGLTPLFYDDPAKQASWASFLARARQEAADSLADVVATLTPFVLPILAAAAAPGSFDLAWPPGGPWRATP